MRRYRKPMLRLHAKFASMLCLFLTVIFVASHHFVVVWQAPSGKHHIKLVAGLLRFAWVRSDSGFKEQPGFVIRSLGGFISTEWLPRRPFPVDEYHWVDLPLWIPLGVLFPWTIMQWRTLSIRKRRERLGHCIKCNYDLEGNTSGACPECGTATA